MSQLRRVFSGLAQSWTKPTTVPNPPERSRTALIRATRSSGRADGGSGARGEGDLVHGLIGGGEGPRAGPLQGPGDVFVMMPEQAITGLGASVVAGVGNMPAQQHAPVLAIDGLAVLGGGGLREAPLRGEG